MIPADQALIRAGALATELGISASTLRRRKKKLAGAAWGRGMYLVQKLRDMGVLPRAGAA